MLYGDFSIILKFILSTINIKTISFNSDISPFSLARQKKITSMASIFNIQIITNNDDFTLLPITLDKPYYKFHSFENHLSSRLYKISIDNKKPIFVKHHFAKYVIDIHSFYKSKIKINDDIALHGGRFNALSLIKQLKHKNDYHDNKNSL